MPRSAPLPFADMDDIRRAEVPMNARVCKSTHQLHRQRALSWLADESGAIGVEYGLLVDLIALVVMGTIRSLGLNLANLPLQSIIDAIQAVI
jgi:Flp pilus assembly pilin Flp